MIRPITADDTTALIAIAVAIGFQPNEMEVLSRMLADYLGSKSNGDGEAPRPKGDRFWLADNNDEDGLVGVAYCETERMTDRTWNLQLIAIHPDHQRQGRGEKLLHYVEETLKARDGRMLLVETLASFDHARAFYKKCGFEEEACIRDFYATGDDKIVFRKVLHISGMS